MTTLLAIGDMHLGRPPVALPPDLLHRRDALGPECAWQRAVDLAIERRVDAVLLAGDVVERNRDFFVAYGQLRAGVESLAGNGIPVLAVAGNHDTEVLPRLADEIDQLHLLGRDGRWQTVRVDDLDVIGWSFPHSRVRKSPLDSLDHKRSDRTTIGLLHCDRDQAESHHAPVTSDALERAPVDAWLLGHIHRPDELDDDRPIGYLGSITALRASETGARGPWLVQVEGADIAAQHLALAPLRYEEIEIDCSGLEQPQDLGGQILEHCRERVSELAEQEFMPDAIGLRIRLTGHTELAVELPDAVAELTEDGRSWEESGTACFIQKIVIAVLPRLELRKLAGRNDPCGLLARRLVALEEPGTEEYQRLVRLGHRQLDRITGLREFRDLGRRLDDTDVAAYLRQAGLAALTRLIAQQEGGR